MNFDQILKDVYRQSLFGGPQKHEFWPFEPPKTGARRILERWCQCGGRVTVYTSLPKPHHKLCEACCAIRVLAGELTPRPEFKQLYTDKGIAMRFTSGRFKLDASL